MPIPGYNGIDGSGVLLSSSNLTALSLSSDKSIVSVEPGNRWRDVYAYLKPFGLSAVGGRVGHVGVPGLLLGGGISFYSSEYGFASDNVIKYQVCFPGPAQTCACINKGSVCSLLVKLLKRQQRTSTLISSGH
jgi:FAD/FMN-containing dehydrogenase